MRIPLLLFYVFCFTNIFGQDKDLSCQNLLKAVPEKEYENILIQPLKSDSLSSSFLIFIKNEVKAHKHEQHSENIYILQGKAEMQLGDKTFAISEGDYVFIPKNTYHSVINKSKDPLKVLSVQSPFFDGNDRIFKK